MLRQPPRLPENQIEEGSATQYGECDLEAIAQSFQSSQNRGRGRDIDTLPVGIWRGQGFSPLQSEDGSATAEWAALVEKVEGFQSSQSRGRVGDLSRSLFPRSCRPCFSPLKVEEGSATQDLQRRALCRYPFQSSQSRGRVGDAAMLDGGQLYELFQSSQSRGRVGDGNRVEKLQAIQDMFQSSLNRGRGRDFISEKGRTVLPNRFSPLQSEEGFATLFVTTTSQQGLKRFSPLKVEEGSVTSQRQSSLSETSSLFQSSPNRGRVRDLLRLIFH